MSKILVVDGDPEAANFYADVLEKEGGYQVEAVRDSNFAIELLDSGAFDVVMTEFAAKDAKGQNVLDSVVERYPHTKCIIFTKHATIKDSVEAIKRGAFDYLTKPSSSIDIIRAVERAALTEDGFPDRRKKQMDPSPGLAFENLVGKSPEILEVFKTINKVANEDSTVLITGESGTGKELIARAIHYNSDRREKPWVVINCGAIPGELLESELFGHEKGAFTGAHRTRIGRFEIADGGSIFLDEIGDMSPGLQVKLLRVLQEQSFERVGSTKSLKVNIRIIAATNKDLINSIEENKFREDLYYRLNVIPIHVPPLRKRKSDIPLLIQYFLKRLGGRRKQDRKRMKSFSDEALEALMKYDWPGNIRELENLVERLSVLVEEDIIQVDDFPERIGGEISTQHQPVFILPDKDLGFNDAVEQYQRGLILQALNRTNWVKAKAADLLRMNRTTLVEKIKKMRLEPAREEQLDSERS